MPAAPIPPRRALRLVQRLTRSVPSVARAALSPGGTDHSAGLVTRAGATARERLREVGEAAATGSNWTASAYDPEPARITFTRSNGRDVTLAITTGEGPAYVRTRRFAVTVRGTQGSDPDVDALVRALAVALEAREDLPGWSEPLRRPILRQVSYHPGSWRLELRPSLVCNHHCAFCNSPDRGGADNVSGGIDDLLAEVELWASLPVHVVTISGGEPTLLRRLPELVAAFADRGFLVELQTNGMKLAEPGYASGLAAAGVRLCLVSLHTADAITSDAAITGFDGGWSATVAGIDAALEAGMRVAISHVVHAANADHTEDFFRFVAERWGRRVQTRLAFVAPTGGARDRGLVPPLGTVLPGVVAGLSLARRERLRVKVVAYCGIPPCLLVPYEDFTEVVRGIGATNFGDDHTKLPACDGCRYAKRCPGLWTRYLEAHGDPGLAPL